MPFRTPRIVILGPQGAGKGTQAGRLKHRFHIPHISTGDLLRGEMARGTNLGKRITSTMNAGKLIPVQLTNAVMKKRLAERDCRRGWISDGYPRSIGQARPFLKFGQPNLLIHLHLTDKAAIKRLSGRRVCPRGHIYHLRHDPPKKRRGYCDRDGLKLKQRDDDTPKAIRQRLRIYHGETEPVLTWLKSRIPTISVDAHQSIHHVYREILDDLKHFPWLLSPKKRR